MRPGARPPALAALALCVAFAPARAARAQRAREHVAVAPAVAPALASPPAPAAAAPSDAARVTLGARGGAAGELPDGRWWPPLASAIAPGAGQFLLKQDRFMAYVAMEAYFLSRYVADRTEGRRQRDAYRQLANEVARALYTTTFPVGPWEYYERMEHFTESGVYDLSGGSGPFQPETDTTTYNGYLWLLARKTYWSDPAQPPDPSSSAYRSALQFYSARAVRPEYRWSWRDAQLEQDLFRRTIARSNDAFRRATADVAVILANHVLSTIDAYATVRLRTPQTPGDRFSLSVELPWPGDSRATSTSGPR